MTVREPLANRDLVDVGRRQAAGQPGAAGVPGARVGAPLMIYDALVPSGAGSAFSQHVAEIASGQKLQQGDLHEAGRADQHSLAFQRRSGFIEP